MKLNGIVLNLCLFFAATLLCLMFLEVSLRGYHAVKRFSYSEQTASVTPNKQDHQVQPVNQTKFFPLHVVVDAPFLYGLNPEHPEISSQGLRDDKFVIPKPAGTLRILVLGDSIAYGVGVSKDQTFPKRLQTTLRRQFKAVDVINSGVSGYSAYNELQFYLSKGREFEADIVIVAFCMNDVANPRLQWWGFHKERLVSIPDEAIPNIDYDRNHAIPRLKKLKRAQQADLVENKPSLLERSELYNSVTRGIDLLFLEKTENTPDVKSKVPTYITGEDTLSIKVLLDETSPEWKWLTSVYDKLHNATEADHAKLIIAVFPLAYQLDKDYPFFPQENIARYCRQNSIPCIDLLTPFRQHRKEDIFFLNNSGFYDVWHLTENGHEISAEAISRFLLENNLLQDVGEENSPNMNKRKIAY
ncbi:MAG: hypothetical protein HZB61_09925 [Nitrospirae bacterium]|nr:hypothetical protein [Nitrospirota bacterium]